MKTNTAVTMTNAQRQAAWRQRQQTKGQLTGLLQAHLELDILTELDDFAASNNTNRVQILRTLLLDLLREDQTNTPLPSLIPSRKGRGTAATAAGKPQVSQGPGTGVPAKERPAGRGRDGLDNTRALAR